MWVDIPDFTNGQIVDVSDMQAIWGNLYHLKNPMFSEKRQTDPTNTWTNTGTASFADIDTTKYRIEFESFGGDVMCGAALRIQHSVTSGVFVVQLELDGVAVGNADGLARLQVYGAEDDDVHQLLYIFEDLDAGEHTVDVQWKNVTVGTATLVEKVAHKMWVMEF